MVNVSLCAVRGSSRASSTVTKSDDLNTTFSLNMKGTSGPVAGMATNQSGTTRKLLLYDPGICWDCGMFYLACITILDTPDARIHKD